MAEGGQDHDDGQHGNEPKHDEEYFHDGVGRERLRRNRHALRVGLKSKDRQRPAKTAKTAKTKNKDGKDQFNLAKIGKDSKDQVKNQLI